MSKHFEGGRLMWLDRKKEEIPEFFQKVCAEAGTEKPLFVGGHFRLLEASQYLTNSISPEDILYCSNLRDPYQRFCSHYEYHLRNPSPFAPSIAESLESSEACQIGIYASPFGVNGKLNLCYYLGSSNKDLKPFARFLDLNSTLKPVLTLSPNPIALLSELINRVPLERSPLMRKILFEALLGLASSVPATLNRNPSNEAYREKYPREYEIRRDWFQEDYKIIDFCLEARAD